LDEPSRGSNATQYLPAISDGTIIGSSFSSDTNTAHACELYNELTNISLDRTSNFFCVSPVEFSLPAVPSIIIMIKK
jgi:hypothetical protein